MVYQVHTLLTYVAMGLNIYLISRRFLKGNILIKPVALQCTIILLFWSFAFVLELNHPLTDMQIPGHMFFFSLPESDVTSVWPCCSFTDTCNLISSSDKWSALNSEKLEHHKHHDLICLPLIIIHLLTVPTYVCLFYFVSHSCILKV